MKVMRIGSKKLFVRKRSDFPCLDQHHVLGILHHPAMEAGIFDHVWDLEEIIALLG
jgi:hypothetical protein